MMDSSTSRTRAGYTMVPKDDTAINTSSPDDDLNGEDESRREQELGEGSAKLRRVFIRDK